MPKILIIILLPFWFESFGQQISVDSLFIPITDTHAQIENCKFIFPVIKTGTAEIDNSINKVLRERFTDNETQVLQTDSFLFEWFNQQYLNYLDFEITYLSDQLISLNVNMESCSAYCSSRSEYFTFNLTSGKLVHLNEIIDTSERFRSLILCDLDMRFEKQKTELRDIFLDNTFELDEETYNWALDYYNACINEFKLKTYSLYPKHIVIINKCYLPNAIKNLTPHFDLKYGFEDILKFLKTKL